MSSIAEMVALAIDKGRKERAVDTPASEKTASTKSETVQMLKQAAHDIRTAESEVMLSDVAALLESIHGN